MNGFRFSLRQCPVGQGGFHVGSLAECKDSPSDCPVSQPSNFRWIYDCGSNQIDALNREIGNVRGGRIDVLFLSHLDSDHVNGVDKLLVSADVKEVVLPYLGNSDWVLHLAAEIAKGTLTGTFVDMVADPAGWFGSRGVDRLTYVEADGDENEGDMRPTDQPSEPQRGNADGHTEIQWSNLKRETTVFPATDGKSQISVVKIGEIGSISMSGHILGWVLSPYAYRPSDNKMEQFRKELEKTFGKGLTAGKYAGKARTASGRELLRKCYERVWKDQNLHSMALYAGPSQENYNKIQSTAWLGTFLRRIVLPGWVSTGDFDAAGRRRCDKLPNYYSRYAGMVGHLTLPHHGSDASFDAKLLDAYPGLFGAIAPVGPNSYGHPGCKVLAAVAGRPKVNFVRVDENPSSRFSVAGYIRW